MSDPQHGYSDGVNDYGITTGEAMMAMRLRNNCPACDLEWSYHTAQTLLFCQAEMIERSSKVVQQMQEALAKISALERENAGLKALNLEYYLQHGLAPSVEKKAQEALAKAQVERLIE